MSKIEYRVGNLLDTEAKYIVHGCNSKGIMGSGVALAIRNKWPSVFWDYKQEYDNHGLYLGTNIYSDTDDGKVIVNAITQKNFGRDSAVTYVSYAAIMSCMLDIERDMLRTGEEIQEIAMPLIGAGLANGKWDFIAPRIEKAFDVMKPIVYVLDASYIPKN